MTDELRDEVRRHYARAALAVIEPGGCCGGTAPGDPVFGPGLYDPADLAPLPPDAVAASLGCGNPTAMAELRPGEVVLDLGSGGGIDVLLAAARVGPGGVAYGLDMTDEMLALARRNAEAAGAANARFLRGEIEAIPLPDASVDVVISNCVVNLSTDKPRVFAEIARVLRPGGRVSISDVVADDALSAADRAARGDHVGCIAGALSFGEYAAGLAAAGLVEYELVPTHRATDGLYNAIIRARRPGGPATAPAVPDVDPAEVAAGAVAAARALPADGLVPLTADRLGLLRVSAPSRRAALETAVAADIDAVVALVQGAGLPVDGLAACVRAGTAIVCREHDGSLLGVAATERFGTAALLRSVAVVTPERGRGLGRALVERALADARDDGAREAWLLTETAEPFFAGLGWERVDRAAAPPALAGSIEFAIACPRSAVAMRRAL